MRLVSFEADGRTSYGAVTEDGAGVVDLGSRLGKTWPTLLDAIRAGGLDRLSQEASGAPADLDLAAIRLLPPIHAPEKIICVGVNYANRNEEYKDGSDQAPYPSLFIRFPDSFVGHGSDLVRPPESEQLDYEGEIALVIGRTGRRVKREDALTMVAGATLCNEGTIRDWLRHAKFNVTQGKNFDRTGAFGPWLVPVADLDLTKPMELTTRVNGEVRQHDTTANMIFGFAWLIEYVSTFATLKPGDIIVTGTPTGAGARFDPPKWLKPGDVVEVEVPEIGILRNGVADEA